MSARRLLIFVVAVALAEIVVAQIRVRVNLQDGQARPPSRRCANDR